MGGACHEAKNIVQQWWLTWRKNAGLYLPHREHHSNQQCGLKVLVEA